MAEWHSKAKIRHKTNVPTPTKTKPGTEKTRKTTGLSNINPRSERDNKIIRRKKKNQLCMLFIFVYLIMQAIFFTFEILPLKIHTWYFNSFIKWILRVPKQYNYVITNITN